MALPSAEPGFPLPASVKTTPAGDITLTRLFPAPAMKRKPEAFTARPAGFENRAFEPMPSSQKGLVAIVLPLPAARDTNPSGVIDRMLGSLLPPTYSVPLK